MAELTSAQSAVIDYFRTLDRTKAAEEMSKIVKLRLEGAKIDGPALAAVFDKLGYDGKKEVRVMTYDFADQLAGVYKELRKDE